tara:strand:- start:1263 stop:1616 length:354 start_codon:yes stop_codon:yes gene_type:complete
MKKVCSNEKYDSKTKKWIRCQGKNIAEGFSKTVAKKRIVRGLGWTRDESQWVTSYWCSECLLEYSTSVIKPRWNKKIRPLRETDIEKYLKVQEHPKFIPAAYEPWNKKYMIPYFSKK